MTQKEDIKSILVIVIGLLLLSFLPKLSFLKPYLTVVAILVGLVQLILPNIGHQIVLAWFKLGHALGFVNSRIILSLVFYLILFPISIFYRLSAKNSLQRKPIEGSIFNDRNHTYTKDDLKNIW